MNEKTTKWLAGIWTALLIISVAIGLAALISSNPNPSNTIYPSMQLQDLNAFATSADVNNSLGVVQANILSAISVSSYWAGCVPVDANYVTVQNQTVHRWELYCPLTQNEINNLQGWGSELWWKIHVYVI